MSEDAHLRADAAQAGHIVLQAKNLSVDRAGKTIISGISLQVNRGTWTAVVGPNGAGKSTLLQALAGLLPASAGEVLLDGQSVAGWAGRERARRLAWLGQGEPVDEDLEAGDVVMLGRLPHRAWLAPISLRDDDAVRKAMQVAGCLDLRQRRMGQLSGGERQRVLLARALAVEANILLMDEPLANLDPPYQAEWIALVRKLVSKGVTVVSVLHELNAALQADDLLIMRSGRIAHHGPVAHEDTRQALETAFDSRVQIMQLTSAWDNRWITLV